MSGLLGWATDKLASMTSTVMAPFLTDVTPPAKIEIHVSNKQSFRKQAGKRQAAAKRKAKQANKAASIAPDATEEDEQEDEQNLSSGRVAAPQEYEPDERTKEILSKMALAAEERKLEELAEQEVEKEKIRVREEALANSVVREMPADPLAAERSAVLKTLQDELGKIGTGSEFKKFEEFQEALNAKLEEYDDLAARIEQMTRTMGKKTPRPPYDKQDMTQEELRTIIQDEELKEDCNELEVKNLLNALTAIVSHAGQKEFFNQMQELLNKLSNRRAQLLSNFEVSRLDEARQRALERLVILYDGSHGDENGAKLNKEAVVGKNLELPVEFSTLSPHQRKIERKFLSIITPPKQRQRGRSVRVWGHEDNVDKLITWIKESDFSGRQNRTYDRRISGLIVGRNGATIQQIESTTGTILSLDSSNKLTVYGPPSDVEKVWAFIDELASGTRSQQVSKVLKIDPRIGRAILALHRSKVQTIEDQFQCRINIWLQPDDGEPRVFIRCENDKQDAVVAAVQKSLIDECCVVELEGSARSISRMLVPSKLPGRARTIYNEFSAFQQDMGLFVQREGVRGSETEMPQVASIWIVCRTADREVVKNNISQILKKADYVTERISIMREQQRIFTADNRGLIEASSGGCRVSIVNNPNEGTVLMLVGTEESIKKGKEIVLDILEREGAVQVVDLKTSGDASAIIDYLLRDGAAVLRSMEDLHAVSIHIDRSNLTAKIVGDKTAIENAGKEINEIGTEIARSQEDFARLVISIDADKVSRLIGRTGQNIQRISSIPGIQSVDVPNQAQTQDAAVVDVVLVGRDAALDEAQKLITKLISSSDNKPGADHESGVEYGNRIGRGRGRRTDTRARAELNTTGTPGQNQSVPLHFEESAFPALGEVMTVDDA